MVQRQQPAWQERWLRFDRVRRNGATLTCILLDK